jgi:hypothetical protein
MERRDLRMLLGLAAASCLLLFAEVAGFGGVLFYVAPALLLAAPLLAGRFLGEAAIERFARAAPARRRASRPKALAPAVQGPALVLPRGGRLMAFRLAVRPPPAAVPSLL